MCNCALVYVGGMYPREQKHKHILMNFALVFVGGICARWAQQVYVAREQI